MKGLTPGTYINRTGRYEIDVDGSIWLTGGPDLPCGKERVQIDKLPPDAAISGAAMRAGSSGPARQTMDESDGAD